MKPIQILEKTASALLIFIIRLYQASISSLLPTRCRFTPTCSNYMIEAISEWGILRGIVMGLKRIARCHPCGGWGEDAVPKHK